MVRFQGIGLSLASAIATVALLGTPVRADWPTWLMGGHGVGDLRTPLATAVCGR